MKSFCIALSLILFSVPAFSQETDYFQNMQGCFLLYNMKTGIYEKHIGGENCKKQWVACSSFKVPLAVMAFDSGVLENEDQILEWDGKVDKRPEVNRDHNAKTWMRDSVVWFSQRLTPMIGEEKFKKYLHDFKYGNEDVAGGLTQAWLVAPSSDGPALKISAYEQVAFMTKLWSDQLPVSPRAMKITRDITYLETSPNGSILSGKTGSNFFDNGPRRLGWFISHVQNGDREYITAANFIDTTEPTDAAYGGAKTKEITKRILADQGLW